MVANRTNSKTQADIISEGNHPHLLFLHLKSHTLGLSSHKGTSYVNQNVWFEWPSLASNGEHLVELLQALSVCFVKRGKKNESLSEICEFASLPASFC